MILYLLSIVQDDDEMTRSIILESPITTLSIANLSYIGYGTRTLINGLLINLKEGKACNYRCEWQREIHAIEYFSRHLFCR